MGKVNVLFCDVLRIMRWVAQLVLLCISDFYHAKMRSKRKENKKEKQEKLYAGWKAYNFHVCGNKTRKDVLLTCMRSMQKWAKETEGSLLWDQALTEALC